MPNVVVKPAHVALILAGNTRVHASNVDRIQGGATAGDEVTVVDTRGNFLGTGWYSPGARIVVRIASRTPSTKLDAAWLRRCLSQAHEARHEMGLPTNTTNGFRLVNSDGDNIPGLIVDRFNAVAMVQLQTIGMQRRRTMVIDAIRSVFGIKCIVDRTNAACAKQEGFELQQGVAWGDDTERISFSERGIRYDLPMELAISESFSFDRRMLRGRIEQLSRGRRVLDMHCGVGSFALCAARGGATKVLAIDDNLLALQTGSRCAHNNDLQGRVQFARGSMRQMAHKSELSGKFDMVIINASESTRRQPGVRNEQGADTLRKNKALRWAVGQGCRLLRPSGLMVVSVSNTETDYVDLPSVEKSMALGAIDAGRGAVIVERWLQGADYPCVAGFCKQEEQLGIIARVRPR